MTFEKTINLWRKKNEMNGRRLVSKKGFSFNFQESGWLGWWVVTMTLSAQRLTYLTWCYMQILTKLPILIGSVFSFCNISYSRRTGWMRNPSKCDQFIPCFASFIALRQPNLIPSLQGRKLRGLWTYSFVENRQLCFCVAWTVAKWPLQILQLLPSRGIWTHCHSSSCLL